MSSPSSGRRVCNPSPTISGCQSSARRSPQSQKPRFSAGERKNCQINFSLRNRETGHGHEFHDTHVDDVVVKDEPESARLDDGDVVAAVGPRSAVNDHGHEVVHPVRRLGVVGLEKRIRRVIFLKFNKQS